MSDTSPHAEDNGLPSLPDLDNLPEDRIPVVLLVHNGIIHNGSPQFVQSQYMIPVSVLMDLRSQIAVYEAL